jgi:hypothetical protein
MNLSFKKVSAQILMVAGFSVLLGACAAQGVNSKPSGFLPDYSLLKPVSVPSNVQGISVYSYTNPMFTRANYHAVIVQPVILYQTADANGVTNDQIEAARASLDNGIRQIVQRKIPITTVPGPGVATLSVAITGAELQGSGMKPWNLIPISAAIKLASKATGLEQKVPAMVVELKFVDSTNGQLLRGTVSTISSSNFSNQISTSAEFQQLAQTWVQQALKYSGSQN